jgi:hypothetical protein
MNDKDKLWTVAHDIIEMFGKDFGPFKNMALRVAYDYIYQMKDKDVEEVINKLKLIINQRDDLDVKKK